MQSQKTLYVKQDLVLLFVRIDTKKSCKKSEQDTYQVQGEEG